MTLIGYMGKVDNPKELVDVSRQVRQSGYSKFDTFSPFPIHGIDKAMEIQQVNYHGYQLQVVL